MSYLIAYAATALVMVALDMVWLKWIAANWYQEGIGHLMAPQVNVAAGALFYALFPIGLVVFAELPSLGSGAPWWHAALMGALFGFFAYATYDLTNLATLKDWPVSLSVMDMAWGMLASAIAATAGRAAASAF